MGFFIEVAVGGLVAGVICSLVALGFVLIFKASGVFNFAQGAMVLFAALSLVRLMDYMPFVLALAAACAIMVALAFAVERLMLRLLVNQEGIILFMATIGLTFFLDGFGQAVWGSDIYTLDLGVPKDPMFILESVFEGGLLVYQFDIFDAVIAGVLGVELAPCFQQSRLGLVLRAVASV